MVAVHVAQNQEQYFVQFDGKTGIGDLPNCSYNKTDGANLH